MNSIVACRAGCGGVFVTERKKDKILCCYSKQTYYILEKCDKVELYRIQYVRQRTYRNRKGKE